MNEIWLKQKYVVLFTFIRTKCNLLRICYNFYSYSFMSAVIKLCKTHFNKILNNSPAVLFKNIVFDQRLIIVTLVV